MLEMSNPAQARYKAETLTDMELVGRSRGRERRRHVDDISE
jgi:hypothetical protein